MTDPALPWDEVVAAVSGAQRVLIVAHVNPDADALGSALALRSALSAPGREVQVSVGQPGFTVPRALAWLPGAEQVRAPEDLPEGEDVVVAVDCASADRLGTLLPRAQAAPVFVVIDHHRSNEGFADINVIEPAAPATGALIAELLDYADWPWREGVAENIYAAVSSDTGSFRFDATSAATHRLAADLHERGVDHAAIARQLFSSRPLAVARLSAQVLVEATYDANAAGGAGVIIGVVDADMRRHHAVTYDDVESVVSDLAAVGEADTAAVVKQSDEGTWKVSLRSKGRVDVGRVASALGGGGHRQAAGYTVLPGSAPADENSPTPADANAPTPADANAPTPADANASVDAVVAQLCEMLNDAQYQLP